MRSVLIAVPSCHARAAERRAQRATWVPHIEGADVRFFLGASATATDLAADEIGVDVDDGYAGLPMKMRAIHRWALERDYNCVLKVDDDVLVFPDRLGSPPSTPYAGWFPSNAPGWCCGFAYWLQRPALEILAEAEIPAGQDAEDLWTGTTLSRHGIAAVADPGIDWIRRGRGRDPFDAARMRQASERLYLAAEFFPAEMIALYQAVYGGTRFTTR